jgi:hypothetical protein
MVSKGGEKKNVRGEKHGTREGDQMANMQIIFGTHYTIATKQHFNPLIFHYALLCPSSDKRAKKKNVCYHFSA